MTRPALTLIQGGRPATAPVDREQHKRRVIAVIGLHRELNQPAAR